MTVQCPHCGKEFEVEEFGKHTWMARRLADKVEAEMQAIKEAQFKKLCYAN
jgi:hypothetical protein